MKPLEEQNLEYYELFQRYLKLYENTLSDYIEKLDCTVEEFYSQLSEIQEDTNVKDKKLLHFVNYLIACTDYPSFYKVMVRAAKKVAKAEAKIAASSGGESKLADAKSPGGSSRVADSKIDSKEDDSKDSK